MTTCESGGEVPLWVYHRDIRPWVNKIHQFIKAVEEAGIDECDHLWATIGLKYSPFRCHGGYFVCPILSEEACDYILRFADGMHAHYRVNPEEEEPYQIPELVLSEHSVAVDTSCKAVGRELIWPLFELMFGNRPNHFMSVQLARYQARDGDVRGTGWHVDECSEASCVISLSPERHTGGGTALRCAGATGKAIIVPPLPKGHGLLFAGRTTLHRGLPLTTGQRNLLVYWCVNNIGVEKWLS